MPPFQTPIGFLDGNTGSHNMPRLEYFLVAESISIDQYSNQVSIFNVLEELRLPRFPSVLPKMIAVSMWLTDATDAERDFQINVRITPPNSEPQDHEQNVKMDGQRVRVMAQWHGFKLPGPGEMLVELFLNNDPIATHRVDLLQANQA